MEPKGKNRPCHRSNQGGSVHTKGSLTFEVGTNGSFAICRAARAADTDCWSETSSMEANVSTTPDPASISIEDGGDSSTTKSYQKAVLEPLKPAEESFLFGTVGSWANTELLVVPWRVEAVNLDDLENGTFSFDSDTKSASESGLIKPYSSSQLPTLYIGPLRWPIKEAPESLPPLTEDYSRDSDSVGISEPQLNREECYSFQSSGFPVIYEAKPPLSPDLGSLRKPINRRPNLEIGDYTNTVDRRPISQECTLINDPMNSERKSFENNVSVCSGDESSDSESIWMSDYSESIPILEKGHPFLSIKPTVVRDALLLFQFRQRTPHGSSSNKAAEDTLASERQAQANKNSTKKRSREKEDNWDRSRQSGDDEDAPEKRPRFLGKGEGHQVSFACPFAKRYPLKYRGCYAYIMKRIRDVKQHLSRFHQPPIYCPRCMATFNTEDQRDEHIRPASCPLQETIHHDGVTRAQKEQLSQRVSSKMALEDQWFTIFEILFPGHQPKPKSPFINSELTEDLENFPDLMNTEGPNIISTAIISSGIQMATVTNEERELSALLQSAITEGLQAITQRWSASLISDSTVPIVTFTEGSTTYNSSHTLEGSQYSRMSTNTLAENHIEGHSVENIYQVNSDEHDNKNDGDTEGLTSQAPLVESMAMNALQLSHSGQSNVFSSETLDLEHQYKETSHDTVNDANEGELWTGDINYLSWDPLEDLNVLD